MRRRALLVLALLLAAAVVHVGPSAAFDATSGISRSVGAAVVTSANSYNAVVVQECNASLSSTTWCDFGDVFNKATIEQTFKLTEETDANTRVSAWRIGGGSSATSGAASTPTTVAVGGSAMLEAQVASCAICVFGQTFTVTWKVEGEKPNRLNSLQTSVQMTIRYT